MLTTPPQYPICKRACEPHSQNSILTRTHLNAVIHCAYLGSKKCISLTALFIFKFKTSTVLSFLLQVVMTVVVAFILEAFMFKIEYRHTTHDNSTIDYLIHSQSLSLEEVHMINNRKMQFWSGEIIRMQADTPAIHVSGHFSSHVYSPF